MACRAFRVAADQRQELPVGADPNAFVPLGMSGNIRTVRFWQSELFVFCVLYPFNIFAVCPPLLQRLSHPPQRCMLQCSSVAK